MLFLDTVSNSQGKKLGRSVTSARTSWLSNNPDKLTCKS